MLFLLPSVKTLKRCVTTHATTVTCFNIHCIRIKIGPLLFFLYIFSKDVPVLMIFGRYIPQLSFNTTTFN